MPCISFSEILRIRKQFFRFMVSSHKLSSLADHKEEILRFKKYRANAMNGESAVVLYCMQRIYRNRIAYKIQCNLINQSVSSQSIIFKRSRKYDRANNYANVLDF